MSLAVPRATAVAPSSRPSMIVLFFFFNDTATTEIYTLSLHDALPIYRPAYDPDLRRVHTGRACRRLWADRKSTRLNSSHHDISYAVFCLNKKRKLCSTETPVVVGLLCEVIRSPSYTW